MLDVFRQFVRFAGAGCVSAIGHYGLLILLVQAFDSDAVVASALGALLGGLINYSLNYRYTFRSQRPHAQSSVRFALIAVLGLALNTVLMWIGVDLLHWHYLLAQVLTTLLVMVWSFSGNRWWTFHAA